MTDVVGVGVDIARRAWRSAARRDATGDAEEVDSRERRGQGEAGREPRASGVSSVQERGRRGESERESRRARDAERDVGEESVAREELLVNIILKSLLEEEFGALHGV